MTSFRVAQCANRAWLQALSKLYPTKFSRGALAADRALRILAAQLPFEESFRILSPFSSSASFTSPGPTAWVSLMSSCWRKARFGGGGGLEGQKERIEGRTKVRKNKSQVAVGISGFPAKTIDSARAVPPHQIRARPGKSPRKSRPVKLQFEKSILEINGCAFIAHDFPIASPSPLRLVNEKSTSLRVTLYKINLDTASRNAVAFLVVTSMLESFNFRKTKLKASAQSPCNTNMSNMPSFAAKSLARACRSMNFCTWFEKG
mmetsp:Transcript_34298/g.45419  ORF Transcript_34298/g.45419 Transcript_34298/m.45419 type:complete len:261 (-) Transcript_34298:921-1703(-)